MPQEPEKIRDQLLGEMGQQKRELVKYDLYYEGLQPLNFVAPELYQDLNASVVNLVVNLPRLATDAFENRLDVEGFRFPGEPKASDELWEWWNANEMDEGSQQGHLESLALGSSFAIIGAGDDDIPLITMEHPLEAHATRDPATRKTKQGIKKWRDDDKRDWCTLYLGDGNRFYVREKGAWVEDDSMRWMHELGEPLIVPFINRARMMRARGVPEFFDVMPIADAINKMCTDMMISAEFHAMPRRWVFGMDEANFQDANGKALTTWQQIAGHIWSTDQHPDEVKVGQFQESDLANFHNSIKLLAQLAAMTMALPPYYMAFTGDNPPSADGIRASESRTIKRAERMQTGFGNRWSQVNRLALLVKGEKGLAAKARRLETVWRDPATPTTGQKADAAQKLVGGEPILPREGAWDYMNFSEAKKAVLRQQFADQAKQNPQLAMARALSGAGDGGA